MNNPSSAALAPEALYQARPLRVLQIHNFYQQTGGEDVVVQNEAQLLQQAGVELHTWYVESASIAAGTSWFAKLKLAARLFWNRQAQQQLHARLLAEPVDVIHLHNSFPLLSPAIIHTARRLGVPLLLTVHNFRWCHPAGSIQQLVEVNKSPWRFVGQRLYRDSRIATLVMLLYIKLHQWLGSYRLCTRLICPSEFVKTALLQAGFDPQQLLVKPHSVAPAIANELETGGISDSLLTSNIEQQSGYALFVGRADAAKGLHFLLQAWQQVSYPIWVAGVTEQQAALWPEYRVNPFVRFLGPQSQAALAGLYQQASLLLVPSLVAETFGNVVIEAFCQGTPCLVSDAGALPELLRPRHNVPGKTLGHAQGADVIAGGISGGQVFKAGDSADFIQKLQQLLHDPVRLQQLSRQARQLYQAYYLPQQNQQALLACYQQVLAEQGKVVRG